jgi:hypothetical protein
MQIEINEKEHEMLVRLIERELGNLGPEIHHTSTPAFHRELKEDKKNFIYLLDRLNSAATKIPDLGR